ncbi:MAG: DNA (cytosine-5-)-methyltransferase, partial [Flavobacteriaceae bacterium]
MLESNWDKELKIKPIKEYRSIELFAGAGGLAIGLEKAGFNAIALNEIDKDACATLRKNRPEWNVIEGDISNIDFTTYKNIDFLSGGFPCQAFSYAGNKLGFEDTRGTLFFEFAR